MTVVLDASAGIEITLNREKAVKFVTILENATSVITTDLYKAETCNVIWKYCEAGLITKEKGIKILELCNNLVDEYVDISSIYEEALMESLRLHHPIYDLLYFLTARRNAATLLTLNKKLNELAKANGLEIVE